MAETALPPTQPERDLVVVVGYMGQNGTPEATRAIMLRAHVKDEGRHVTVIGNGTKELTPEEVGQQIEAIGRPVDLVVVAHGINEVPSVSGQPGNYSLTFSNGQPLAANARQMAVTAEVYDEKTDQMVVGEVLVAANQVVPVDRFFKAMPENVKSVFLGSCYSEAALEHADKLPEGTVLYASSRTDQTTMAEDVANSIAAYETVKDTNGNGTRSDEIYANYREEQFSPTKLDGTVRQLPENIAISGQGMIAAAAEINAPQAPKQEFSFNGAPIPLEALAGFKNISHEYLASTQGPNGGTANVASVATDPSRGAALA